MKSIIFSGFSYFSLAYAVPVYPEVMILLFLTRWMETVLYS